MSSPTCVVRTLLESATTLAYDVEKYGRTPNEVILSSHRLWIELKVGGGCAHVLALVPGVADGEAQPAVGKNVAVDRRKLGPDCRCPGVRLTFEGGLEYPFADVQRQHSFHVDGSCHAALGEVRAR